MSFLAASGLINFATCSSLGFVVLLRNYKKPQNIAYFLGNSAISLYSLSYFFWQLAGSEISALFWFRHLAAGIILINMAYLYFVAVFLDMARGKRGLLWACLVANAAFIFCNYSSILYGQLVERYGFGFWPVPRPLFHAYLAFWVWQCFLGFSWLMKGLAKSERVKRQQVRYFMIAAALGFSGGAANWPLWYGINFPPYANILISVYAGIMAYAIIRYRLMDVNLAIARTLVFAMVYALLLGVPLIAVLMKQTSLELLLGHRWWVWILISYAVLATVAHYINLHFQHRAEDRLLAEERRAHEALREISQNMMRFLRLKPLVGQIVRNLVRILHLRHAAVYLAEGDNSHFDRKAVWHHPPQKDSSLPLSFPADSALVKDLRTVRLPRIREELRLHQRAVSGQWEEIASSLAQLQASLIIPAFHRRRFVGFLVLGEKRSGRIWTQDDLNLLMVLANQAALAVENAELYEREEARVMAQATEQTAAEISHGVSHQFNNRLYVISTLASAPVHSLRDRDKDKLTPEELRFWLDKLEMSMTKICDEAVMGGDISKGIMSLAKTAPMHFRPAEVPPMIAHAIEFVKIKHAKEKVGGEEVVPEIVNGVTDGLPKISCNPAQINDCFINVIDNAVDAIREKIAKIQRQEIPAPAGRYQGCIRVKAQAEKDKLMVTVEDDGIGIKKEDLRKIFMPYWTTKGSSQGTGLGGHGLGLYFIRKILEAHKGKLYANSEYGKWSHFMIELPALDEGEKHATA